jgi:outer membrane protein assembly factor BamA
VKMSFRAALCILSVLIMTSVLTAQESSAEPGSFVISEINLHIDGITREGALMKNLEGLSVGTVLESEAALEAYIADQTQQLVNLRQLKEDARIEYRTSTRSDGTTDVFLDIYTEDTWNIIVFPIPEYDSNNGLSVTLKYRDKNFFGTLERFALDLAWEKKSDTTTYSVAGDFTLPFEWLRHQWYWNTGVDWELVDGEHDLTTSTSLGIDLPMGPIEPTFTVEESYNYDTNDIDAYWLTTKLDLAESFKTGLVLPAFGEFSYTPGIFTQIDYKPDGVISESKEGLETGFTHSLGAGRVDWIGNFRKGVDFSVSNTNTYNLQHDYWDQEVSGSLSGYYPLPFRILWWPFAVSGRVAGIADFDGGAEDVASYIRGIRDDKMGDYADYGAFVNTDLTMSAFTIPRFVEGQGSVYFDAGYVREKDASFNADRHLKYGVGLEAIGFPLFARSYYIRASLGFDLKEVLDEGTYTGDNYELFIVLGHHY